MGDNRIPDNIFKLAVEKACEIETSIFEKRFKDTDKYTFSEKYLEKIQILKMGKCEEKDSKITNYSVKKKSTKVKILLIAAIVMLLGAMTVTAEPVREFIFQIKEKLFDDHTHISIEQMEVKVDEAVNTGFFIVRTPDYVPSGYKKSKELKDEIKYEYSVEFVNSNNQILTYQQWPIAYMDSIVEDLSALDRKDMSINGEQIFLYTDENDYKIYVHERGSYVYVIRGALEIEEFWAIFDGRRLVISEEEYPRKMKIVPEGFAWTGEDNFLDDLGLHDYSQWFLDSEKKTIIYNQQLIEELDTWSVISDGTEGKDISICGDPAKVIIDESGWNTIIYTRGEFVYKMAGDIDFDLLVECLEAVFEDGFKVKNEFKDIVVPVGEFVGTEVEPVETYEVVVHADEGLLMIEAEEVEAYTTPSESQTLWEGDYLNKLFDIETGSWIADIKKDGYKFTGWTVYEGDFVANINNEDEFEVEEGMTAFEEGPFMTFVMDNVELYAENISTEELKKIECTGKSFYVIANWEKVE